jgi:hypothetical protein
MKIWVVTMVGDGEPFSVWITEALAFEDAEKLAIRTCAREAARGAVETQWTKCVDRMICEHARHRDLDGQPMWEMFRSITIFGIEVQGEVIDALAKVAE